MSVQLFLNLLLAHLVGDFYCQTTRLIVGIRTNGFFGGELYVHAFIIFVLSWLSAWSWSFWWAALAIGVIHVFIDVFFRVYLDGIISIGNHPINTTRHAIWPFLADQIFHVAIIAFVVWWWQQYNEWSQFPWLQIDWLIAALVLLLCWIPSNILIRYILNLIYFPFELMQESVQHFFRFFRFISPLERLLMVFFISIEQYVGIGAVIAVVALFHYGGHNERERSEYVVIDTLLNIAIAIGCGYLILFFR